MKLISMTDLVLQGYNINQINNYAKFLNQPLKLEMFVPCDEDGNTFDEFDYLVDIYKHTSWFKSKEKVLFEGFGEVIGQEIDFKNPRIFGCELNKMTIEDLVNRGITLSDAAKDILGL